MVQSEILKIIKQSKCSFSFIVVFSFMLLPCRKTNIYVFKVQMWKHEVMIFPLQWKKIIFLMK